MEELERSLDAPLHVLFIRQLLTLRDKVGTLILDAGTLIRILFC